MNFARKTTLWAALGAAALLLIFSGCKAKANSAQPASAAAPFMSAVTTAPPPAADEAPPPDKTGGFDGKRAYAAVAKQVSFGPRPAGSPALAQTQDYLLTELKSYGCTVEVDSFSSDTPAGRIPMKNILVKIPGEKPGIILLATHYDTKRLDNFVDGEEAVRPEWQDPDNCYGSREMAARFAASGDLPKIKALMLADIVGTRTPHFKRETYSTKALVDLVWGVAKRLGYGNIFVDDSSAVEDDHQSFLKRHVPSVDVIDLDNGPNGDVYYWHTPQDALDKISPKTLAIVGHVFLESVKQLQAR